MESPPVSLYRSLHRYVVCRQCYTKNLKIVIEDSSFCLLFHLFFLPVPHKDILDQDSKPLLQGNSSYNSFKLKLTNPFSNTQGDISKYKLLVMRKNSPGQPSANDFNGEPMKWSDIESTTGDYIYQPFPDCNDFGSFASGCEANKRRRRSSGDTIDVQIGVEPCDGASSAEFCNGPLQPMSDYYVALRAYTVHGDYYEHSGISNAIQTGRSYRIA